MPPLRRDLLQELLTACGPGGEEDDVRAIVRRELKPVADDLHVDAAGNVVARIAGGDGPVIRVMAHMDELAMIVKRVEPDGSLRVNSLGTMYPGNFGLGPVTLLGDRERLPAVLVLGSEHTTQESSRIWETKPDGGDQAMQWRHVYVYTGRSPEDLAAAGVHAGTRVCVHESKRRLIEFGDFIGCYFLDDRAALVSLVEVAARLRAGGRPPGDVYLVATTSEEMGGIGAAHANRTLPGDTTVALDVGAAEAEYRISVDSGPVIAYADDAVVYDKAISDRLLAVGEELGLAPSPAVWQSYDSDAGRSKAAGLTARAALISLPTLSTHGYEVMHAETPDRVARLLAEYLCHPEPVHPALRRR